MTVDQLESMELVVVNYMGGGGGIKSDFLKVKAK
jgi:hypothetical protein